MSLAHDAGSRQAVGRCEAVGRCQAAKHRRRRMAQRPAHIVARSITPLPGSSRSILLIMPLIANGFFLIEIFAST